MPLVVAERRQTAARPANPALQPWQTQLIQAPALAPTRPHTHTNIWMHTHRSMCEHVCKTHCHTHMRALLNPQCVDFTFFSFDTPPHRLLFFTKSQSSSSFSPSVATALSYSHSFFASHFISPFVPLSSAPLPFLVDLLPHFLSPSLSGELGAESW